MSNRTFKFRAWDALAESMFGEGYSPQEFWSMVHPSSCDVDVMQFTGLQDMNGKDIYEDDLVNICYESKSDGWFFDGVYRAEITPKGVNFHFIKLLWESYGFNQYPVEKASVTDFGFLAYDYKNKSGGIRLCVQEASKYKYSNYVEVIGNIHENPELLENTNERD